MVSQSASQDSANGLHFKMSPTTVAKSPPERSPEPLWRLVQSEMAQRLNELSGEGKVRLKCWPVVPRGEDDQHRNWTVVVITDAIKNRSNSSNTCNISIGDEGWWSATPVPNPSPTILLDGRDHSKFVTLRVKVPRNWNDYKQPPFTPLEMSSNVNGGTPKPICTEARMRWARLRLSLKSGTQLNDQFERKVVPDAAWKFKDPKMYEDIFRWGTLEEAEFEAAAIRDFNRQSVYQSWLILCHPSDDELPTLGSQETVRQECIVIVAVPKPHDAFPQVGDLCDLAFSSKIPALDENAHTTKNNHELKRARVKYFNGVRLDNPYDKFNLDGPKHRSKWNSYSTFKVSLNRKSNDYSPFKDFAIMLDATALVSGHEDGGKPLVTLDDSSAFQAHVWIDISDTKTSVELNGLKKAMKESDGSRISKALTYIQTFEEPLENINLFQQGFSHMEDPDGPNSQLPGYLKTLFNGLDQDQKHAYRTVLANLPCRVGIIPGGPGSGKTELMLTISALALSNHGTVAGVHPAANTETISTCGPILLILEANRPANAAATRVVEYFEKLGRTDLRVIRAFNFNWEGAWNTRRHLVSDEIFPGFNFDECFPTHRADHIPQVRHGSRIDCRALTLKEAARQYLAAHHEDFPLLSALIRSNPEEIDPDEDESEYELHRREWYALFSAVLARTDIVISTTVGAAKIAHNCGGDFRPRLVIFDDAARARELSTLVAIANFPDTEAWLFTGTCEMSKPYVASHVNPKLWNPCADQLRHSMMERCCHAKPDIHRLSLNHQALGDLHHLTSDIFWSGEIQSAFPDAERFPPSTMHLLEYCRSLASNPSLSVPRLLVHVRGSGLGTQEQNSRFNNAHLNWVVQRVVRDLVLDQNFRSVDNKQRGSIIITTPYKAQFTNYRKEIDRLMRRLDIEHRAAGGSGKGVHREAPVEARTADTVQGHSADVVVYDLVSSEVTSHLIDPNRTCVALSRSKQA